MQKCRKEMMNAQQENQNQYEQNKKFQDLQQDFNMEWQRIQQHANEEQQKQGALQQYQDKQ